MVISVNLLRTDDKMIKYQYLAEKYSKTHDAKSRFLCPKNDLTGRAVSVWTVLYMFCETAEGDTRTIYCPNDHKT